MELRCSFTRGVYDLLRPRAWLGSIHNQEVRIIVAGNRKAVVCLALTNEDVGPKLGFSRWQEDGVLLGGGDFGHAEVAEAPGTAVLLRASTR